MVDYIWPSWIGSDLTLCKACHLAGAGQASQGLSSADTKQDRPYVTKAGIDSKYATLMQDEERTIDKNFATVQQCVL